MALWVCAGEAGCGTKYAVGLFRCPRCHGTEFFEDGDPMAKISRHGGASDATLPTSDAAAAEPDHAPAAAADHPEPEPVDVTEHVRGEDGPELVDLPHGDAVVPAVADTEEEASPEPDYEAWTVEQLKEQLDSRGLPKTGKKDDLVLRLLEDDDARAREATD